MQAFSKTISGYFATTEVEGLALRETLKGLIHLQLEDVTSEMDCKMVVDA